MSPPAKLSWFKRLAFSLVWCVLVVVGVEFLLFLTGKPLLFRPFVCEESGKDGRSCKYLFNEKTPAWRVPKPAGRRRVLVVGESAVKGYPFEGAGFPEMMQVWLERRGMSEYEIVNLGANGINSAFLREVLREALTAVEPDLVVIYAGNNELLGHEAIDDLRHPLLSRAQWWLRTHSRLWNLPAAGAGMLLAHGLAVDLMVRVTRMEEKYDRWLFPPAERAHARDLLLHHLAEMVELCRQRKVPAVFCTVGGNLFGWVPMKSVHSAGLSGEAKKKLEADLAHARRLLEASRPEAALPLLENLTARDPDYAKGWFFRGRAELGVGKRGPAVAHLEQAVETADFFQQVPPSWNQAIRTLARQAGVPLLDVERAFRQRAETENQGGFQDFVDGCHPTLAGHHFLAGFLLQGLAENGFLPETLRSDPPPDLQQTISLLGRPRRCLGLALFNQAMVLAFLYPPPEYRPAASAFLADALALDLDPALVYTYLGYLAILQDHTPRAAEFFSLGRKADPKTFTALLRTKFAAVAFFEDPWLWLKKASPDQLPALYPSVAQKIPPQTLDRLSATHRLYWTGTVYQPAPVSP